MRRRWSARIEASDAAIEAWACLDRDHVMREAARLDALPATARGPLHGAPVGLKDIIHTTALPTRMGSPAYADFAPSRDAACVRRLVDAGGYAFGKTVTTELAYMHPGKTRNPWNAAHTPGGSSQGSAAAVAAGHVPAALGTQTNGSVIRPAAYCGVVGFKPTLGVIPFDGASLFSQTLDTIGTFTRTVADAALVAGPLAVGTIPRQPAAMDRAPRLACLAGFPWTTIGSDVDDALDAAAVRLRAAGAEVVAVALPDALGDAARVHRTIMLHEAVSNLGPLQDRARTRLSATLNAALDEGRAIDAAAYALALVGRHAMIAAATDWLCVTTRCSCRRRPPGRLPASTAPAIRPAARWHRCWVRPRSRFPSHAMRTACRSDCSWSRRPATTRVSLPWRHGARNACRLRGWCRAQGALTASHEARQATPAARPQAAQPVGRVAAARQGTRAPGKPQGEAPARAGGDRQGARAPRG